MAKVKFTSGRIEDFRCEKAKIPSFLWDSAAPGLGLRASPGGAKSFIFQGKLNGQVIRITIGDPRTWTLAVAQSEARRLKVIIDSGQDPRQVKADGLAAQQAEREAKAAAVDEMRTEAARQGITLAEIWPKYVDARKSKWSAGHLQNHMTLSALGGEPKKRGKGMTVAGPMAPLMSLALSELTGQRISEWLESEAATRPTNAAQSYRLLRAFIRWAADFPAYRGIIAADAYSARTVRDALPKSQTKDGDSLQREQLPAWFAAARTIGNPVISAYLQALLLTGARREELAGLRWEDVDFKWRSICIKDKVDGLRTIPLTPYVAHLLATLPRRNEWVFSSVKASDGKLAEPRIAHTKALAAAGLPHVSLHGLRRSFGTLCEWVEMPSGISAQIMGHKPSALAEKHYRRRPLDLLRKWHDQIEVWVLEQAQVNFVPASGLRVVSSS
ncbi:MAG: integrase family protein [Pseudomonadota bacterium]